MKNEVVFITGGAGFLGCHLIERLIEDNKVIVFDVSRNNLEYYSFITHPNFSYIEGSILDYNLLKESMKDATVVFHMAAIAGVDNVLSNLIRTMEINIIGTYNVMRAASEYKKIYMFINFSTSEVFGTNSFKQAENDIAHIRTVGEGRWTYAISKLSGEYFGHSFHQERRLPVVTIRPFNVYGPRQSEKGGLHEFVLNALRGEDLIVYGDGTSIRSYCYISDFIDGLMLAVENFSVGATFNIGNPRATITAYGLALAVARTVRSSSQIRFTKKDIVDVELRVANIDKAFYLLGYRPKVDLEEGLQLTSDWYRKHYGIQRNINRKK